jgi:uncharacterized membrane protein YwzB
MIILSLIFLAFICINIAFHSMQVKKIDKYIKAMEKELLEEFKTIK